MVWLVEILQTAKPIKSTLSHYPTHVEVESSPRVHCDRPRASLWFVVHNEIRRSYGVVVIHHEFVIVQADRTGFRQYLSVCYQWLANNYFYVNAHRIVARRWLRQGEIWGRHLVTPTNDHFTQQHRLPIGNTIVARERI
jgi:hypothetical protein